jgi:hypothetical protein
MLALLHEPVLRDFFLPTQVSQRQQQQQEQELDRHWGASEPASPGSDGSSSDDATATATAPWPAARQQQQQQQHKQRQRRRRRVPADAMDVLLSRLADTRGRLAAAQAAAADNPCPSALVTFRCGRVVVYVLWCVAAAAAAGCCCCCPRLRHQPCPELSQHTPLDHSTQHTCT